MAALLFFVLQTTGDTIPKIPPQYTPHTSTHSIGQMHNNTDAHPNNLQFNTTTIIQDPISDLIDYDTTYSYALAQHSTAA